MQQINPYQIPRRDIAQLRRVKPNNAFNSLTRQIKGPASLTGPVVDNYNGKTATSTSNKRLSLGKILKYGAGALGIYFLYKFAKNKLGLFGTKPAGAEA